MKLIADLHIHSRFSRATSKSLDFVALHRSALEKGLHIIGTGDFTHPGWLQEIREQLVPAEDGLFKLRPDLVGPAREGLPASCAAGEVRFCLEVEISNIYKKDGRVRKNHNLVYVPSLSAADKFSQRLSAIGNLASDGRPILGLDARNLLEITLESDPLAFLIPAHIWTPWFSALGSKSGFDSLEECFGDLTPHIFAAETGLSSDPAMNWRVSSLDRVALVSNSDAHSAAKLGREANLFDVALGYEPLLDALRTKRGFLGTIEFFPEEGKYHLDGHRKCDVRLSPDETRAHSGRCPKCGGVITVGVMSRVDDLADRVQGERPDGAPSFSSLVSLSQVVAEAHGVGAASQKIRPVVGRLLENVGPELMVLKDVDLVDIERVAGVAVREAVRRVRAGELTIDSGYDGEYGTVRIFGEGERDHLLGQTAFLSPPTTPPASTRARTRTRARTPTVDTSPTLTLVSPNDPLAQLDDDQRAAAEALEGPLLVVAGPGSGKTRTLAARIAHQVTTGLVRPDQVLAISFTNQAADELRDRLARALPPEAGRGPLVATFHALGLRLLEGEAISPRQVLDDATRLDLIQRAAGRGADKRKAKEYLHRISLAKQTPEPEAQLSPNPELCRVAQAYEKALSDRGAMDVDDLVLRAYRKLCDEPSFARQIAEQYRSISVDEYQDVNDVQAALVKKLAPTGETLCVIGDPDQSIYGFRGARPEHFRMFAKAYPSSREVRLSSSYRLSGEILAAARSVLTEPSPMKAVRRGPKVEVVSCLTAASEAEQILVRLERIVGGTSFFAMDSGRGGEEQEDGVGFGDVAVLTRTKAQRAELLEALGRSSVPCRSVGEDEPHDPRSEKVAIMTMHACKGREFEVVFVAGVEPGLVPLDIEGMDTDETEERRILYVALTRAKRRVIVTYAKRRRLFGRTLAGGPSHFLSKVPKDAATRLQASLPKPKRDSDQLKLF